MTELAFAPTQPDASVRNLRVPPHSLEAEQAVLGGLMLDNEAWDQVTDVISSKSLNPVATPVIGLSC